MPGPGMTPKPTFKRCSVEATRLSPQGVGHIQCLGLDYKPMPRTRAPY
jgi:hypothetical protein